MDLPKQEEKTLRFWKEIQAFERSVNRAGLPRWKSRGNFVFYEGPPTANGRPGIHHILARAFKDIICRYKTMQGYRVERRAGWDTHGLPVEVEVEKELGLKNKREVEEYGIGKFNEKCRESVWRYKQEWDKLTERIAFWLDLENPYITYDPIYMETVWGIIKKVHDKKLLYEGYKVVPYCPRCGTSLSSHEVAQGYEDITEDSVFIKFKVKNPKQLDSIGDTKYEIRNTFFLAWTTTPWTLPGNVALAVGKSIDYVLVKNGKEYYILAKERVEMLDDEYEVIKKFKGKELEGIEYEPLFDSLKDAKEKKYYVALADFVTTEEGTGIVHTAVMYGEDDYILGQKLSLPRIHTVDEAGKFNKRVSQWQGKFVKDVEPEIIEDLKTRGFLYKKEPYTHSYPFCWRCKSPLLYYAMQSWFIKMSALRSKLIANNKKINWIPKYIQEGRFGEWLREVKDWNFSRRRFWGTPLPVWRCKDCSNIEVIGSRKDLSDQNFGANTFFILRHGNSEKNDRLSPIISSLWPESKKYHLTKKGIGQVQKSAKILKKKGGADLIFASDFTRTKETAGIVAKEIGVGKVNYDKRLREYDLGAYDGGPESEFEKDFPDYKERFVKAPLRGETLASVSERMFDFISWANKKYKNKRILIVSHGDPIWILQSRLSGLTIEEALKRREDNYPSVGQLHNVEFRHFPYNKHGELDFHRPYVDEINFQCEKCLASPDLTKRDKGENSMRRVEDLIDVWFDSGSMPFASASAGFPADYISEGIDMTRGWFYTLLAVSTILGHGAPYKNVISLAHVLDKHGKKMSKTKGNVVDPWEMTDKYGSDALRWYFYTVNQPGDSKNFDEMDLRKTYRKFISTLANTLKFYMTYKSDKIYKTYRPANYLDKWIVSRLNSVIQGTVKNLNAYDVTSAARSIERFVIDDLSNWYVRRSRKRFQNPETEKEKKEAEQTLGYVLLEASKLCAPFIPFLSEHIYQELGATREKRSIHWEKYATTKKKDISKKIEKEMEEARIIVEAAREQRASAGIKVRQPLLELTINKKLPKELLKIIADEVNVKEVKYMEGRVSRINTEITLKLREEGFINEFMRHVQNLRKGAELVPKDKIELRYSTTSSLDKSIDRFRAQIRKQNNAFEISGTGSSPRSSFGGAGRKELFKAEGEFEWEGSKVWVGIKKNK